LASNSEDNPTTVGTALPQEQSEQPTDKAAEEQPAPTRESAPNETDKSEKPVERPEKPRTERPVRVKIPVINVGPPVAAPPAAAQIRDEAIGFV
jgi:hypothetical protein